MKSIIKYGDQDKINIQDDLKNSIIVALSKLQLELKTLSEDVIYLKDKNDDIGNKIAMHITASNPLAIDKTDIKKEIIEKELEIIKAEISNSDKPSEMVDKISKGKIAKFINDNTLLNQIWIMDPKKKVSDILKENKIENEIKILNFVRYKVGEGI